MDTIIFSRLKAHVQRRLNTQSIVITEDGFVELLCFVCEFVEGLQQQTQLTGDEKKALVLNYYKRLVLENISDARPEFVQSLHFFLDHYTGQIIDLLIKASKGSFAINKVEEKKKGKK